MHCRLCALLPKGIAAAMPCCLPIATNLLLAHLSWIWAAMPLGQHGVAMHWVPLRRHVIGRHGWHCHPNVVIFKEQHTHYHVTWTYTSPLLSSSPCYYFHALFHTQLMSASEYLNHRAKDGQRHDHVDVDLHDAHAYTKGLGDVQNRNCRNPE
jgi:hypothetical protein